MGLTRGSLALPRMNAHRLVIIAAAFTIAVAAALATALVTVSSQALPRAVRHDLSRAAGTSFVIRGNVNAAQGAQYTSLLPGKISAALEGAPFGYHRAYWSDPLGFVAGSRPAAPNIVGGLDLPDSGQVRVGDRDVTAMSSRERMELRRSSVAFIFQSFGLIPILSAAENVGVPLRIAGMTPKEREERVRLMLDIVGLGEHARQRPGELSGGQQQRVAIARALADRPQVLLADEPTGQLDSETAKQIMRLLRTVVQSEGVTALVATHDPGLIDIADSVLELEDGTIKTD